MSDDNTFDYSTLPWSELTEAQRQERIGYDMSWPHHEGFTDAIDRELRFKFGIWDVTPPLIYDGPVRSVWMTGAVTYHNTAHIQPATREVVFYIQQSSGKPGVYVCVPALEKPDIEMIALQLVVQLP